MSSYGTLIHFTDACVHKTMSEKKTTSILLLVSFTQNNWSRCIGFVRHFTRKVDQRQMERRRNENGFVVVFI